MSPDVLVIVSCGKSKRRGACYAMDLYTGALFRSTLSYARSVVPLDRILIASAKYGLIQPKEIVETYDLTMGDPGAVGSFLLPAEPLRVLSLCSKAYNEKMSRPVEDPLAGLNMFQRMSWLRSNLGRLP